MPRPVDRTPHPASNAPMHATILTEPLAGLQAQALGLAEAAAFEPTLVPIAIRAPWQYLSARFWPAPLRAAPLPPIPDGVLLSAGGTAAVLARASRRAGLRTVQIQHPRMDPAAFDAVIVNRHDGLIGPNVIVTRTALHRATALRLWLAGEQWAARLAHLPRPLVSVLVGGSNGRFTFGVNEARALGAQLADLGTGVALTPSRRTDPAAIAALRDALPLAWIWDGASDNPYFGLLALADAIVVTEDSVSMISEACATHAPVYVARLPGRSRRIRQFTQYLIEDGRVRDFTGRYDPWPVQPLDDTQAAADEMRHRLGL